MMNKQNILLELNELKDQGLINYFSISDNTIIINTLDPFDLFVSTDFISFYKLDKSTEDKHSNLIGNTYESFEQLLSHLSNEYNKAFSKKLYDKLFQLSESQKNGNDSEVNSNNDN